MAAKLIDLSFTLNGRKVKVQIAPDTMLFALLREQGCASVRCACETTNCGLCTVWLDGDPVLSCSVPAARVEGHTITTLEGLKAEIIVNLSVVDDDLAGAGIKTDSGD